MVAVHMRDDLGLRIGERPGIGRKAQFRGLDPGDAAKAGDEMAALDFDPIEVEIGKTGIGRALEGWRAVKRASGARVVAAFGAAREASAAGPASGSGCPATSSNSSETAGSAARFFVCWARSDSSKSGLASISQAAATSET